MSIFFDKSRVPVVFVLLMQIATTRGMHKKG